MLMLYEYNYYVYDCLTVLAYLITIYLGVALHVRTNHLIGETVVDLVGV